MTHLDLFDIDGVLADDTHRLQYALDKNWTEYFKFENVWDDVPLDEGFRLLSEVSYYGQVKFLTGRRTDLRWVTLAWLNYHWTYQTGVSAAFDPDEIYMRPIWDGPKADRPVLAVYKEQVYRNLLTSYDSITLYEDDPEVVYHIRKNFGRAAAVHCTWYIKNPAMVKEARS